MSKVIEAKIKLINEIPDRHCNRLALEKTPDGYHLHFRNLKILLNENEFREWKEAFKMAKAKIIEEQYLKNDI